MTEMPAPAQAEPRSRASRLLAVLAAFCTALLYAIVALALRLVMARVFFLSGQPKIEGPRIPLDLHLPGIEVISVTLPAEIKPSTFVLFETEFANLPMSPAVAAYLFTYAEFVLPICMVLGFATRLAALGLIGLTLLLHIYVAPALWWTTHVYWICILMVLVARGPGAIAIDAIIRLLYRRDRLPAAP